MKNIFAILIIFIMLFSCEKNPANDNRFVRGISVGCLLSSFYQEQQVVVYYATGKVDEIVNRDELFAKDAEVTIKGENQEINFHYYVVPKYGPVFTDLPDTLQILSGKQYHLKVETDVGNIVGETTVPGKFRIIAPEKGKILNKNEPTTIKWSNSIGAHAYIINIKFPAREIQITPDSILIYHPLNMYNSFDTTYTIPQFTLGEQGKYVVEVMACDDNFKNHLFNGSNISGIEGGYGFFGSAMVDSLHFFVTE